MTTEQNTVAHDILNSWSILDIPAIPLSELTENDINGEGAFDVLMSSVSKHLHNELKNNRIRTQDYAAVFTSAITDVLNIANNFTLQKRQAALEAKHIEAQIDLINAQKEKIPVEIENIQANTELVREQIKKIPHEIELAKQEALLAAERVLIAKEELALAKEHLKKQPHEIKILEEQANKIEQEILNLICEQLLCQANKLNIEQQTANLLLTADIIPKQGCVLDAEFDVHKANIDRISAETLLIGQKKITELAQVNGNNIDEDSVIGRQKSLYAAQTKGFDQDAKMKFAKLYTDTWGIRASTDTGTEANNLNKLADPNIGEAMDIAKRSLD